VHSKCFGTGAWASYSYEFYTIHFFAASQSAHMRLNVFWDRRLSLSVLDKAMKFMPYIY
jgi:hypothetical protein